MFTGFCLPLYLFWGSFFFYFVCLLVCILSISLFLFPYVMENFREEVYYYEEPDYSYICTIMGKSRIKTPNDIDGLPF